MQARIQALVEHFGKAPAKSSRQVVFIAVDDLAADLPIAPENACLVSPALA
jgi:hypothetical protein